MSFKTEFELFKKNNPIPEKKEHKYFNQRLGKVIHVDNCTIYVCNGNIENPKSSDFKQIITVRDLLNVFKTEEEFLNFIYEHKITIQNGLIANYEWFEYYSSNKIKKTN